MFFALLNDNFVVYNVGEFEYDISSPQSIKIEQLDETLIGKQYNVETMQFVDFITAEVINADVKSLAFYALLDESNVIASVHSIKSSVVADEFKPIPHLDCIGWSYDLTTNTPFKSESFIKSKIKEDAAEYIRIIEGEDKWRIQRAQERAKVSGDYSELDLIYAKKELVRVKSDEAELAVQSLTQDELNNFAFSINLSDAVLPVIHRITVGAFISRYTPDEYNRIKAASEMEQALFGLQGRTHVDLSALVTQEMIGAQNSLRLLGPVQEPTKYSDRVSELLRSGSNDEAYRGE